MDDVIIGGSFVGLATALQLGRARRKVTVLDTGLQRNPFAGHSHGLPGHDHRPPATILAEARKQLVPPKSDTAPEVEVDVVFAHPHNEPSASLHESLALDTVGTPFGIVLKVDERRETSMPGIYADGALMASVTTAIWQGATAEISARQSMLV